MKTATRKCLWNDAINACACLRNEQLFSMNDCLNLNHMRWIILRTAYQIMFCIINLFVSNTSTTNANELFAKSSLHILFKPKHNWMCHCNQSFGFQHVLSVEMKFSNLAMHLYIINTCKKTNESRRSLKIAFYNFHVYKHLLLSALYLGCMGIYLTDTAEAIIAHQSTTFCFSRFILKKVMLVLWCAMICRTRSHEFSLSR